MSNTKTKYDVKFQFYYQDNINRNSFPECNRADNALQKVLDKHETKTVYQQRSSRFIF